jgi:predicted N-acyltransferase
MTLAMGALATFAFYQWTQKCTSAVTFFVSATALIIVVLTLGGVCFFILRIARRPDGLLALFNKDSIYGRRWGTLYDTLHEGSLYFVSPLLIIVLARSAITGFGQGHGLVQVCISIVLDIFVCVGA